MTERRSSVFLSQRRKGFLIIAAALSFLIGMAVGGAGVALFRDGPEASPEIEAGVAATHGTAVVLLVMGTALIMAGVAALLRRRVAWGLGVAALVAFVAVGFVSNYVLFGSMRLSHTLTNVLVAALVMWLLSKGKPALGSDT